MIILPDISQVACMGDYCVRYAYLLFLLIPAFLLLVWLIPKTFVKFSSTLEQKDYVAAKKPLRKPVFWLRFLALLFLIIAFAAPFKLTDETVKGDPRLTILVDNSSSMGLFNTGAAGQLYEALEGKVPVKIRTIATGTRSPLGDGILNNLEGGENLLVVTDGNNNRGKLLGDVVLFASSINATISTLDLVPERGDVSLVVEGPSEMIRDNEGDFTVRTQAAGLSRPYRLRVLVDGADVVMDREVEGSQEFTFTRAFSTDGSHRIEAEILGLDDHFPQNNKFYKAVKVVPRPSILFVADQGSPLLTEMQDLYNVDFRQNIPGSLDPYMAVVLDNMHASSILPAFDQLSQYVTDGNGLVVIGGPDAYESGGYKGTLLETLLPVKMGASEESNKSDVNVVIVIDISSSSQEEIPLQKALALSVLDNIHETTNVGVVAFNSKAYEVEPIKPLEAHEDVIRDKISKLAFDGQSLFNLGIGGAYDMLQDVGGSKNIIFISDGSTTNQALREQTLESVRQVNARGTIVYTVGVESGRESMSADARLFMDNIARLGDGIFFPADETNKLKVIFGEEDPSQGPEYYNSLTALDTTHFITRDIPVSATISGYNYVIPKPVSQLLVSTNKNIPVLVVWRFGLGRVVTLATDDGNRWAGELLNQRNSRLITRSINWAIGDLSRKESFDVSVEDTWLGQPALVSVVAGSMPSAEGLQFAKIDTNLYTAEYRPGEQGFFQVMGTTAAANYNEEYKDVGMNQEFTSLVEATGGRIFAPGDVEEIIAFVQENSKRIKINSRDLRWPFLLAGLLLFLLDIAVRRMRENKG